MLKIKLFHFLLLKYYNVFDRKVDYIYDLNRMLFPSFKVEKTDIFSLYKKHFPTMHRFLFYEYLVNRYFSFKKRIDERCYGLDIGNGTLNSVCSNMIEKYAEDFDVMYDTILYKEEDDYLFHLFRMKEYMMFKGLYNENFNYIYDILKDVIDRKKRKKFISLLYYLLVNKYLYHFIYRKYRNKYKYYIKKTIGYDDRKDMKKFRYYGKVAHLYVKCTFSNVFFTLADRKGNVFFTCTPGQISDKPNKKYKLSVHLTEKIVTLRLLPVCKRYGIKRLFMIVSGKAARHLKSVSYFCRKKRVFFND